ncbi:MAG: DNA polymerase Y family protein [Bifidobacteriaceae bacterium]|jgi:protein ImuB|nr:DNA polymerase Y family protein [Bifidobacteriaceae bacterium]
MEDTRGGVAVLDSPLLEELSSTRPARRLAAVWLPDWPVVAAIKTGVVPPDVPVIVADARRVKAVSAAARVAGVRRGMKRRSATAICPAGVVVRADPMRDARAFEDVAILIHSLVPGVELLRPGLLLCPAVGVSRYHGGDQALAEHLLTQVAAETGAESWVGIADGLLAAILAARQSLIIEPGGSPSFLAPHPLTDITLALQDTAVGGDLNALTDLLTRLGIKTLGGLADLPSGNVAERFGSVGIWAQRLARARDVLTGPAHRLPQDFSVSYEADPPLTRIAEAAHVAVKLADDLHAQLTAYGQSYDRLKVSATTETGEQFERTWRLEGVDSNGVADRVRWQLENWLTGRSGLLPDGALTCLTLEAEEVHPASVGSACLWGNNGHGMARAVRGAERINTLLGGHGVYQPVIQGGRTPRGRIRLVEWGDDTVPLQPVDRPWPGAVPDPAPSLIPVQPQPVALTDAQGNNIRVSPNFELSSRPALLDKAAVRGWAGPWPVFAKWWVAGSKRLVYLQVQIELDQRKQTALLVREADEWRLEGIYD